MFPCHFAPQPGKQQGLGSAVSFPGNHSPLAPPVQVTEALSGPKSHNDISLAALLGDLFLSGVQQPPNPLLHRIVTGRRPPPSSVCDSAPPAPTGVLFSLKAEALWGEPSPSSTAQAQLALGKELHPPLRGHRPAWELACTPCMDAWPCSMSTCCPQRLGAGCGKGEAAGAQWYLFFSPPTVRCFSSALGSSWPREPLLPWNMGATFICASWAVRAGQRWATRRSYRGCKMLVPSRSQGILGNICVVLYG